MTTTVLEKYVADVLPPEKADPLFDGMPKHIRREVFERNLMNALMANPDLMQHPPALLFREVAKAAGLGLLLDPLLGEAYIVVAYNYKSKKSEPQLRVGYKGMVKLARQAGTVNGVYVHEVCKNDKVEVDLGFPKVFHHRPVLFGDRGEIIGYVATITFKDGTFDFEPMSVEQCHEIRDRSDAWKAFKADKIKSTPWQSDDSEMCKKTTLRRLMKRQDQSPEMVRAQQIEDEAEHPDMVRGSSAPALPRDSGPPRLSAQAPQPEPEPEHAEEGEVDDTPPKKPEGEGSFNDPQSEPEQEVQSEEPSALPLDGETFATFTNKFVIKIEATVHPGDVFKWGDLNRGALDRMKKDAPGLESKIKAAMEKQLHKLRATAAAAAKPAQAGKKAPAKRTKKADKNPAELVPDPETPEETLKSFDAMLAKATTGEELESIWNEKIMPVVDKMLPPDQNESEGIYQKHEKRLGGD